MNDIINAVTPSSGLVTNLSIDNVSLQTKIELLEEEIKILDIKATSRPNLKLLKTYPSLKKTL